MSPNDPFCLPANPEVSGVGIRVAIYTQTLLTFISAFCIHSDSKVTIAELNLIEAQSSIILITALGILISAILKGLTHELSNVHAAVVLNLNWMSSVNVFIYVLLYLRHTIANSGSDDTTWGWRFWWNAIWGPTERVRAVTAEGKYKLIGERGWTKCHNEVLHQGKYLGDSTERKSPAFVLLLSTIHLSLMAIFGFWLWTDPSTFSHSPATCSALPSLAILGHIIPITSSGLRNFSIAIYSLIATPLFNIFIPMALVILFHIWFNRRYQSLIPMNAFLAKAAALIQPQSPSSGMGQNEMFPISVCLVLLVAINAIFVVDTEATLYQNRYLQETGGSGWTFGQILATLLLLIPLCGTVMRLMRCYEWKAQDQFKKVTVAASKLEEGKLEQDKASALPLFQAVYQGQLEYVKYLGENGAYLDLKDQDGNSLLHQAAMGGHLDIVQYLEAKKVQLSLQDKNGNSPLHQATIWGYLDIVKYLGDKGAQLDLQDVNGNSALHQATIRGYIDIVKYLKGRGAQLNLQDGNGNSPLHQATLRGYSDIVKFLGDHGAQLDLQDKNGNTLLHQATNRGYLEVVRYLGDKGAQLNLQDEHGNSPLHWATIRGYLDIVRYLVDRGAQLDLQDKNGNTPLHQATIRGYFSIVKYLGDKGAKLDLQDENGNSPLHQAEIRGNLVIVKYMGDKGAQLNLQDKNGNSPLHQATLRGYLDIVKYLGDKGAKLDLQDENGTSPLHQARHRGNLDIEIPRG